MRTIGVTIFISVTVVLALTLIFAPVKTAPIGYQGAAVNTKTGEVLYIALVPVQLKQASATPAPSSTARPTPSEASPRVSR